MASQRTLRRRVLAVGALVILAFVGDAAYDSWRLHQQVMAASTRELGNLSRSLAAQADRTVQAVDELLAGTVDWAAQRPTAAGADQVDAALAKRLESARQVTSLALFDAHGRRLHRSGADPAVPDDVSTQPYFTTPRDDPRAGLSIVAPVDRGQVGALSLVLSRRITAPDGRFAGVAVATLSLQQLREVYQAIDLGASSTLLLTLADGTLVIRQPMAGAAAGRIRMPELVAMRAGAPITRMISLWDGRPKLIAATGVAGWPLILAVQRDEADALKPWVDESRTTAVRTLLLVLATLAVIAGALRQLRQEAELERRLQETRRLEALGTLAGGIAHDFNNILGAILGFGEMAQQRAEPGTPIRRDIDRVLQSGARARLLVRRILDFSRSGLTERTLVNVQGVVEEVVAMLAPSLPAGVAVEARLESGAAAIHGDATQLHQVAMNLATNALQALGERGHLAISLARERAAVARPLLQGDLAPGDYVRLTVSDDGPGIAPEILPRIFEPFFTTKKGSEGTGLGLSVVHGIVAGLAGAIDIAARDGGGTVASVWLPVSGELAPRGEADAPPAPAGRGQVVMVVDDDTALLQLAEERLAEWGYEPVGYASAEAALAAFHAEPGRFDAVLTDHMLPGLTGGELARRLLAQRPDLPVALMSGHLSPELDAEMKRLGVRAALHKPLAARELAELSARLFDA